MSPFMPFLPDEIYTNLTGEESVHLASWPDMDVDFDEKLIAEMKVVRELVEVGHRARRETKIKVKQPLSGLSFINYHLTSEFSSELIDLIKGELNVKNIEFKTDDTKELGMEYDTNITEELKHEGDIRELIRSIQEERKNLGLQPTQKIDLIIPDFAKDDLDYISKKIMAREIKVGETMAIVVAP
jgi:isoleucyl-tRNA synthetase